METEDQSYRDRDATATANRDFPELGDSTFILPRPRIAISLKMETEEQSYRDWDRECEYP